MAEGDEAEPTPTAPASRSRRKSTGRKTPRRRDGSGVREHDDGTVSFTVRVSKDVHASLKEQADERGYGLSRLVERGLVRYVEVLEKEPQLP